MVVPRLAAILAGAALGAGVAAQTGRAFISVEAHVAAGFAVHVGRVTGLEPVDFPKPSEGFFPGAPHRVAFEVSETIKGAPAKSLEVILTLQHTFNLEYLRDHKVEVMLVGSMEPAGREQEVGLQPPGARWAFRILQPIRHPSGHPETAWIADRLNTSLDEGRMFDLELKVIRSREGILKRARAFARKHPEMLPVVFVRVPNEFGLQCGSPNAYCGICIPVCPEAKKVALALRWDPSRILRGVKPAQREGHKAAFLGSLDKLIQALPPGEGLGDQVQ